MSAFADPREGRRALLSLVDDGEHWIELRAFCDSWKGPRKRWPRSATDADAIAASLTSQDVDVHVGMAPRLGREGDDERRYAPLRVLWADCDSERAVAKLAMFEPPPTAVVLSGGVDGVVPKRHAWWALTDPVCPDDARGHLLRLAHHLDADLGVCDPARVLRLPGSRSHKTRRVARLDAFTGEAHELAALTADLDDPPASRLQPVVVDEGGQFKVPIRYRHNALVRWLGIQRSMGFGEAALIDLADVFLNHGVEINEARCPLDREHAHDTARDIARRYPSHRTNGDQP